MATTVILPPTAVLETAAAELVGASGTVARQNALNKGLYDLLLGAELIAVAGGFLLPSSSRSGLVHRYDNATGQCDCEAGRNGRTCRHAAMIEIVEQAQQRAIPVVERITAYKRAMAASVELFG